MVGGVEKKGTTACCAATYFTQLPGYFYGTLLRLELCINIGMSLPCETVTQYEVVGI